jgi:hypothetical protein
MVEIIGEYAVAPDSTLQQIATSNDAGLKKIIEDFLAINRVSAEVVGQGAAAAAAHSICKMPMLLKGKCRTRTFNPEYRVR